MLALSIYKLVLIFLIALQLQMIPTGEQVIMIAMKSDISSHNLTTIARVIWGLFFLHGNNRCKTKFQQTFCFRTKIIPKFFKGLQIRISKLFDLFSKGLQSIIHCHKFLSQAHSKYGRWLLSPTIMPFCLVTHK